MKYYIKSGEFERIVTADSPTEAASKSIIHLDGEELDWFFYVDERGFRAPVSGSLDTDSIPAHAIPYHDVLEENDNSY